MLMMGAAIPFTCNQHLWISTISRHSLQSSPDFRISCQSKELVPDIWRFSAERYGDRVALLDPYHNHASKITYKQIKNLWDVIPAKVGDKFLSMLSPWHAYERACEYFIFTLGVEQTYTTTRKLKDFRVFISN
ncbi:long-chain-fatty-acid--[acyl-carrier-protein] ligase AEE15, chloroplastic-like isoform X2 [Cucurbita moschata]|uniref:Long-chain-fatty-acid--[acyl-carrier-protein] ligase AEE15, chloroplastic-like isoform X2 n=1 Tax=Cucurbita moschata TaxID=3662 RepID=A0A6J1HKN3_CUCMO|nr:long-chain-fatty-acid--[acyl-carrier-protein] ligase AEE15, chloroplastic-like isoform X2 [Cucurbita moschata]